MTYQEYKPNPVLARRLARLWRRRMKVPEVNYLEFKAHPEALDPLNPQRLTLPGARIELQLANGQLFDQTAGDTVTVESDFDSETGNIPFRADFPNPSGLRAAGGNLLITNLTGHPQAVVPNGLRDDGTPTSITFTGGLFGEGALCAVADAYQRATRFHQPRPPYADRTAAEAEEAESPTPA